MQLKESEMKKNKSGIIQWPKMNPGDCFIVEKALIRRFLSIVSSRGLRSHMMSTNDENTQYMVLTPQQQASRERKQFDWRVTDLTEDAVPRNALGNVNWSEVFDDDPPEKIKIESKLAQRFVSKCSYYGHRAKRKGMDENGLVIMQLTPIGKSEPITAKQVVKRDFASLPPKWIIAIHDGIAAKAKLTPLTEEQRAELMETW
jgi:hypothetical protein